VLRQPSFGGPRSVVATGRERTRLSASLQISLRLSFDGTAVNAPAPTGRTAAGR
jgi:hypothetical protein